MEEEEIQVNVEDFDFSNDGYEKLHDEEMDRISVSIYGDCEEIFTKCSRANLVGEAKMKISLSQEQLKLDGGSSNKNFLTVPTNTRKSRSLSFFSERPNEDILRISQQLQKNVQPSSRSVGSANEIIYAVPQKPKKSSSAIDDDIIQVQTTSSSTDVNFKYPLVFYCKICNNILNDPRILNCLHTFCCLCLAQLDATNDLQNNQFWRKISDSSSGNLHF